jgi:hypothetical protein
MDIAPASDGACSALPVAEEVRRFTTGDPIPVDKCRYRIRHADAGIGDARYGRDPIRTEEIVTFPSAD